MNCEVCEVGEPEAGVMEEEREDGDGECGDSLSKSRPYRRK